jgi:chondroitin AC lyase
MKFNNRFFFLFCIVLSTGVFAQKEETEYAVNNYHRYYADGQKVKDVVKEKSIQEYRQNFSLNGYLQHKLSKCKITAKDCTDQLTADGQFADMIDLETKIYNEKLLFEKFNGTDNIVANFLEEAHNRFWKLPLRLEKGSLLNLTQNIRIF